MPHVFSSARWQALVQEHWVSLLKDKLCCYSLKNLVKCSVCLVQSKSASALLEAQRFSHEHSSRCAHLSVSCMTQALRCTHHMTYHCSFCSSVRRGAHGHQTLHFAFSSLSLYDSFIPFSCISFPVQQAMEMDSRRGSKSKQGGSALPQFGSSSSP